MENEAMNNLVFIGIPLDTVIVSGITSDSTVQVTATNGVIVIGCISRFVWIYYRCKA